MMMEKPAPEKNSLDYSRKWRSKTSLSSFAYGPQVQHLGTFRYVVGSFTRLSLIGRRNYSQAYTSRSRFSRRR